MALPPLLKYVYSTASDEVIRRGKRIFLTQGAKLIHRDEVTNQVTFKVRNDQYNNQYNVVVSKFTDERNIALRCACPYNLGEVCRHEVAALFQLNDLIASNTFDVGTTSYNQIHTVIRMKAIDVKSLRMFASDRKFDEAEKLIKQHKAKISKSENELVEATIKHENETFSIKLKRNDDKSFDTSCTCSETKHPLCVHKTSLFIQLLNNSGPYYFDTIRNWESQKNKLLSLYGYSLNDDLTNKFEFYYQDGKPFLKVLDTTIKKVSTNEYGINRGDIQKEKELEDSTNITNTTKVIDSTNYEKRLGIVFNLNTKTFPFFAVELIEGVLNEDTIHFIGNIAIVDTQKYIVPERYPSQDRELIALTRKLQNTEIAKYISKNSPFGDIWDNIVHEELVWTQENKELFYDYTFSKLLKLFSSLSTQNPTYILPQGKVFKSAHLKPIQISNQVLTPTFKVEEVKKKIKTTVFVEAGNEQWDYTKNELQNSILYLYENELLLIRNTKDASAIDSVVQKAQTADSNRKNYIEQILLPISRQYHVDFDKKLIENKDDVTPQCNVLLGEQASYFTIKPFFTYENTDAEWNDELVTNAYTNDRICIIKRNKELEQEFINKLQHLHTNLRKPNDQNQFLIHSKYALQKNWFFLLFDKLKEWNVNMLGYEQLKNFKINKAKPQTRVQVNSNVDWFDTTVDVTFEGQVAQVNDIKKALASKQNYVQLGDGTFGLLPEEWLQKFSLLFKMADTEGKKLKVSKYNFGVIDELYDLIDDEQIKEDLNHKKNMLLQTNPEEVQQIAVPSELTAELRPYQQSGFQWFSYLDTIQWGGLLADDMGLGKTIQTLTFLQHYKNKNNTLSALVVCPTTLLYNWENEIKKFTPSLSYIIHHGSNRSASTQTLEPFNIIISTYGTLRSDVSLFSNLQLDYVILDESQMIKNPSSKVAKAAQLLVCKNRIALSGTPLQNNTFDLYSQMNFLNPGMLGSKEFFKEQFAVPIDKMQDDETKKHLRKLVYPFMLRRTKEQVAKDLPEKTEVTLYCEMGDEQRAIYNSYKNLYRSKILGTIDNDGIQKSQFAILQGLMKLRQICDSPAILNEEEKYQNHSVKIEELARELETLKGNNKVLVFSQFLGMLGLIKEKLKEQEIKYEYFDGSYSAIQREAAIQNFQNNPECTVFLISLKAGGMGLNLTAADYVYLVDPWWNPAVEQQAIDRTHRIGQTKNIFAYRFICKDSVEEKIMTLKDKKNSLAKDIISDDANFVKQLSREDVDYLFS